MNRLKEFSKNVEHDYQLSDVEELPVNNISLEDHLSRLDTIVEKCGSDLIKCIKCGFEYIPFSERAGVKCVVCGVLI